MPTMSRQEGLREIGFNPYIESRTGNTRAWTAGSLTPAQLPVPPGFVSPEDVVAQSTSAGPAVPRTFTIDDFRTPNVPLNDPKLASRKFSSAPTTVPLSVPAQVSAYGNVSVPAFLTDAVNRLNASQSGQAALQNQYRQQLLDAVLSGNYLAAEALRASSVSPGAAVSFGQAVQSPQVGQAALLSSQATAQESATRTAALQSATTQPQALNYQLQLINKQLQGLPRAGVGPSVGGEKRAQLQSEQFRIQRELQKQQQLLAQGGAFRPTNAYVSQPLVF